MLVGQARFSSELFQGHAIEDELLEKIEDELRSLTRNVVLIGMPGAGKTSCGKRLARMLGRPFVDIDEAILADTGRGAAQIIQEDGENAFRRVETEVTASYCKRSGMVIACGGVAWLYHNATPDMLPQIKATFDGQELAPTAYKWHVPIVGSWLRRTYAETLNPTPAELALPVSGASPDLVVTPGGYSAQLTITNAAGESIYDGSATGFRSYRFAENGTYDAKLIVSTSGTPADEATVTGTETWQFRFTVSIKPSIQLATDSVAQGGVAAVRVGQTLGQDAPAIKTPLKNVGFVKAGSGWICYLPIPWNQKPGSIDLEVSADGYTETLSLSVRTGSFSYKDYSKTSQMAAPYIGEDDAPAAVSKLFATVDDKIQWSVGGFVQPFLDSFDTPLTYGMTEYAGRSYSERGTNYGYGGRTSTNVIIRPKNGKGSMIAPASGRVLLAKDLGGLYGNTLVIEHGAGLKSIFYGLASLEVKTGDTVKQGQLLGGCSKAVVAEMRIGTVPIDPLAVWRSRCDGLKLY